MRRKNTPGCYCCVGDCQCGSVEPPEIQIEGYTPSTGWLQVSECCIERVFEPDEASTIVCCHDLHKKTWTQTCTQKGYVPVPIFPWQSSGCPPDPDVFCRPDPPLIHVANRTVDYHEEQRLRVDISSRVERLVVTFGKDKFTCNGVEECKWFIKISLCYKYFFEFIGFAAYELTVTNESLTECLTVDEDCNTTVSTFPIDDSECGGGFIDPEGPEFCFERIKLFDDLPEDGEFEFTNADDGSECSEFPACAAIDFETEFCFSAGCGEADPCWYPYTILDVGDDEFGNFPRVYKSGGNTITSYVGACGGDCIQSTTNCINNPTTCPEVTQILPCEEVRFEFPGIYCAGANGKYGPMLSFPFGFFVDIGQICPTGLILNPGDQECTFEDLPPCYIATTCTVENCGDCCEFFDCGECSECHYSIGVPYIWTQEIEVETTCENVNDTQVEYCCIEYAPVTLDIVFS